MIVTKEQILKYKNPDKRCSYPFTPNPMGYCWSFALHVDGDVHYEDMNKICQSCEYWEVEDERH